MRVLGRLFFWGSSGLLVISSFLFFVQSKNHSKDNEWVNPYDMVNYDSASKSMRNPAKVRTQLLHFNNTIHRHYFSLKVFSAGFVSVH